MITGLAVLGFGAGSMIGAPVGTRLIGQVGVLTTFAISGVIFGVLVALAGAMLRNPPAGYKPAGWSPPVAYRPTDWAPPRLAPISAKSWLYCLSLIPATALISFLITRTQAGAALGLIFGTLFCLNSLIALKAKARRTAAYGPPPPSLRAVPRGYDYGPDEMIKTFTFYQIWFLFLLWASVGLMAISQAVPMGVELARLTPRVAAGALGIMAIFNQLGRPCFGAISDKIGRSNATVLAFSLYIVALLGVLRGADTFAMYTIGISMVGFAYGGALAVMPALTADSFGTKNLGVNYGLVFSAWGTAGVLGPIIGAQVRAQTGTSWTSAFLIFATLSVGGLFLAFLTKAPAPAEA